MLLHFLIRVPYSSGKNVNFPEPAKSVQMLRSNKKVYYMLT